MTIDIRPHHPFQDTSQKPVLVRVRVTLLYEDKMFLLIFVLEN